MPFDLSQTSLQKKKSIWINQAPKKIKIRWCGWKYLFTYGRQRLKTSIASNIFQNNDLSQTGIPKSKRLLVLWSLKKKNFTDTAENIFLRKVGTYLKLSLQEKFFDLSQIKIARYKRLNLNSKEKKISLMRLKIPFYIR